MPDIQAQEAKPTQETMPPTPVGAESGPLDKIIEGGDMKQVEGRIEQKAKDEIVAVKNFGEIISDPDFPQLNQDVMKRAEEIQNQIMERAGQAQKEIEQAAQEGGEELPPVAAEQAVSEAAKEAPQEIPKAEARVNVAEEVSGKALEIAEHPEKVQNEIGDLVSGLIENKGDFSKQATEKLTGLEDEMELAGFYHEEKISTPEWQKIKEQVEQLKMIKSELADPLDRLNSLLVFAGDYPEAAVEAGVDKEKIINALNLVQNKELAAKAAAKTMPQMPAFVSEVPAKARVPEIATAVSEAAVFLGEQKIQPEAVKVEEPGVAVQGDKASVSVEASKISESLKAKTAETYKRTLERAGRPVVEIPLTAGKDAEVPPPVITEQPVQAEAAPAVEPEADKTPEEVQSEKDAQDYKRAARALSAAMESAFAKKDEREMEVALGDIEKHFQTQMADRQGQIDLLKAKPANEQTEQNRAKIEELETANEIDQKTLEQRQIQLELIRLGKEKTEVDQEVASIQAELTPLQKEEDDTYRNEKIGLGSRLAEALSRQTELAGKIKNNEAKSAELANTILQLTRLMDRARQAGKGAVEAEGGKAKAEDAKKRNVGGALVTSESGMGGYGGGIGGGIGGGMGGGKKEKQGSSSALEGMIGGAVDAMHDPGDFFEKKILDKIIAGASSKKI